MGLRANFDDEENVCLSDVEMSADQALRVFNKLSASDF